MKRICTLLAFIVLACTVANSSAAIIAQYDSGSGTPLNPTTQGWGTHDIIEEGSPTPPLATAVNTSGDGSLANAGVGATGWLIHDYLDGQSGGADDRPEYTFDLIEDNYTAMAANGWRFTSVFKMDSVVVGQEMRVLNIDQGPANYLPFDILVDVIDDVNDKLSFRIIMEDGNASGTSTDFLTTATASDFNTVVMEDVDGDGTFTITLNGTPLMNTFPTTPTLLFDSTTSSGQVPGDDVMRFGALSSGGDGGGIEFDLVRLETIPEPASWILFCTAGLALLWKRRIA